MKAFVDMNAPSFASLFTTPHIELLKVQLMYREDYEHFEMFCMFLVLNFEGKDVKIRAQPQNPYSFTLYMY